MPRMDYDTSSNFLRSLGTCWIAVRQAARRRLQREKSDLTLEQIIVLNVLKEEEGINLKEMADRVDRDPTTVSRMITGLEHKDLVVRMPDKTDSRQKLIYLTQSGRQRLVLIESFAKDWLDVTYIGVSGKELQALTGTLLRLAENMEKV